MLPILGLALSLLLALSTACIARADDEDKTIDETSSSPAAAEFYTQKIEPLLQKHCFECHSSDKKQQAGLALDHRRGLLSGGENGPAIDLAKPERSLLMQAIRHAGDVQMPPDKKLDEREIDLIQQWIRMGVPFSSSAPHVDAFAQRVERASQHWAFQPLQPNVPGDAAVASGQDWIRNDIDRFIWARLSAAGLEPAPQADRATLIRRLSLDLLGLPPSPEDVQRFVSDNSAGAWEALVDRMLDSPHYGERWGRHWLDLARYADSSGFHNDLDRPYAWKYRDWVIRSFNDDMPYADFVAQQLAGDEVPGANEQSLIATGFCRNGPSNDDNMGKSEAALKQYRADQLDDVVSTTSTVFLGVTIGCARCHDHKTDPFSSKDYYSLVAIFNGTEKFGLVPGTKDAKGNKLKEDDVPEVHALVEKKPNVPPTYVMRRGNASSLGEEVSPSVPRTLPGRHSRFLKSLGPKYWTEVPGQKLSAGQEFLSPSGFGKLDYLSG